MKMLHLFSSIQVTFRLTQYLAKNGKQIQQAHV